MCVCVCVCTLVSVSYTMCPRGQEFSCVCREPMVAEVLSSEDICVSGAYVTKPVFMCVSPACVWLSPKPVGV